MAFLYLYFGYVGRASPGSPAPDQDLPLGLGGHLGSDDRGLGGSGQYLRSPVLSEALDDRLELNSDDCDIPCNM